MKDQLKQSPERLSYTVDEACAVTGLNRNALYRAIALCQVSTFKVGRRRMVSARALREFIEAKEKESSSGAAA
ncbi:helix-turn-helix domain-containing protein [Stenotrophomonas maltophilia]|uniref:helix-turn-helix domain-containing protein n=1 Tax=Stenotrophomonas maltophilia TaxID=40324 RepID=UPI00244BA0DD|nr:helix-turn-helix domain-containing protein [Stenotrophomonas maltophilia]MDH0072185.1 helix-turn-helix domain-containing protein [Stenotrophomonas maltophilia]MDH0104964.1 helix-turn-helix domain-containing protein [Stenotrophomonas maltophilia]MDH0330568.1 helix-turn-helix domain-containing protein [Stenotrophomonas maltophilia]MDH0632229.1 helix-turn-helix domain-containing protein [Stenotrophomonas maltophilia]MDH0642545.1 helix-turn-helix domain-containing protein [Stenotrophomonas malt